MPKRAQNIALATLLTSYIFVGALAHLGGFGDLFCRDDGPHKVERGRPAQVPPTIVCWTQYKHFPSFTDGTSFTYALVTHTGWPQIEQYTRNAIPNDILSYQFRTNVRLFSRAPPFFAVAS